MEIRYGDEFTSKGLDLHGVPLLDSEGGAGASQWDLLFRWSLATQGAAQDWPLLPGF